MLVNDIKKLLQKKYNGDFLDDKELMILVRHLGVTSEYLLDMGERFNLAFKEAHSIFIDLYDVARYRKLVSDKGYSLQPISEWIEKNI
jgi:hypothetical protein